MEVDLLVRFIEGKGGYGRRNTVMERVSITGHLPGVNSLFSSSSSNSSTSSDAHSMQTAVNSTQNAYSRYGRRRDR